MNTNNQTTKGSLTPDNIQNTYKVCIQKTNLNKKTNTNFTDTPINSQISIKKNEIYQNRFDQLQYQDQQHELLLHGTQDESAHNTHVNQDKGSLIIEKLNTIENNTNTIKIYQKKTEDNISKHSQSEQQTHYDIPQIEISKGPHDYIEQPKIYRPNYLDQNTIVDHQEQKLGYVILEDNYHILKQKRHRQQFIFTKCSQANKNSYTEEKIGEENSCTERKNINASTTKKDILCLENNSYNDKIKARSYTLNNDSKSERKDAHCERKDAHIESQPPHVHCTLTGPLAHSAMRKTYILPECYTRTTKDNPINSIKHSKVNHNTMDQKDYEKFNPMKKPKKHNLTDIDSMQKEWNDLEELQYQQKLILKEIRQAKVNMAITSKRYIPYHDTPLHIASFATQGDKPTFSCSACKYNTESKSYFDKHHKAKSHRDSLRIWNTKQEQIKDNTKEEERNNCNSHPIYKTKYYISTTNEEIPTNINKMNTELIQNTTKTLQNKETTISNYQYREKEDNPSDDNIVYQQNYENTQNQTAKTASNNQTIITQNNSNEENFYDNTYEELAPMEIVETPNSPDTINIITPQTEKNQEKNINIENTEESTNTKNNFNTEIIEHPNELSNSNTYETAIRKIHKKIPLQYRHNLIALLSTIYQSGTDYQIQIEIKDKFQDIGHWILSKYHKLLKNKNTRKHLLNKIKNMEYDLVSKTPEQEEEITLIAGSARIIYDILVHCQFVPIEYLCLLATLLNKKEDYQYGYSSIVVPGVYSNYGEIIDLMLNVGAFYISTKEIIKEPIITIDNENSNTKRKLPQNEHGHQNHIRPTQKTIMTNNFQELNDKQTQWDEDNLVMEVTLQNSFDTLQDNENNEREKIIQTLHKNSHQKTKEHWSSHHSSEKQDNISNQQDHDSPLPLKLQSEPENTVYIEGIQGSEMKEVRQMFELNGPIKNIDRLTASTAIVKFYDPQTAKAAITNLNGILHRNILITVVSCPSQFKEGDDNDTIYVKGVKQSNTEEIKEIFSLNGMVRRIIKLTHNTAIIKFDDQESAKAAILNFNGIIYKDTKLTVLPARRKNKQTTIEDEMDFKHTITENDIDEYKKDEQNKEDEKIEAEIKQELLDIQDTFSNQSFGNSKPTTPVYSIPSPPSSPISWPKTGWIYNETKNKNSSSNEDTNGQHSQSGTTSNYQIEEEIIPHSPTPSSPFHGFETITSCHPDPIPKITFDQRLNAYKDNAWELMVMEDIEIPPGVLLKLPIKITAENNPKIRPLRSQNIFAIIAALYPFPQINDGIYYTNNKMDQVVIKNSSKNELIFKKGEILEGVKAHTHNFVVHALMNNYNCKCSIHINKLENWTKWHHEAKLFQKILADKKVFEKQQSKALTFLDT